MTYVLEKLSGKGVFHNTLMFAGRMLGEFVPGCFRTAETDRIRSFHILAFAFFRIEGVAVQLLSALPTKQATLSRFAVALETFSAQKYVTVAACDETPAFLPSCYPLVTALFIPKFDTLCICKICNSKAAEAI